MASRKSPLLDTATTLGKIVGFLGVSVICGILVAGLLVPAAAVTGTGASNSIQFFDNLPAELTVDPPGQSTKVLAADNTPIATFYSENRIKVPLDQISKYVKDGIVSIEDARFYEHGGVDGTGILRALTSNLTKGSGRQGASTLTQQYVNNVIIESQVAAGNSAEVKLGAEKSIGDKLREMKLAVALEKKYTKDQILEGYLNIVFFNANAYGIEAAAQYFYSVHAKDLTLPQAALLAGLVNSPAAYDPITNPDNSIKRRNLVLDAMLNQGKITKAEHDAAVKTGVDLKITPTKQGCAAASTAAYFCDYVSHLILNNPAYGADESEREKVLYRGGLTIKTTLDPRLQNAAQAQVDSTAGANPERYGASLVTVQPGTGKILAMAQNTVFVKTPGKYDTFYNFNVDRTDGNSGDLGGIGGFDPGSTFKPFTFAEWLNEGHPMMQTVQASRHRYPVGFPWKSSCGIPASGSYDSSNPGDAKDLENASPGYDRNNLTMLEALYNSVNTGIYAGASQLDLCGLQNIVNSLGVHNGIDNGQIDMHQISHIIGATNIAPITMATAFAAYSNNGVLCAPMAITEVTDSTGKKLPAQAQDCKQAISADVAHGVTYGLQQVLKKGSGYKIPLANGMPAAAKTGTSNFSTQTWVVGFTSGLTTASWFGNPEGAQDRQLRDVTVNGKFWSQVDGADIAGPQWQQYMNQVAPLYGTAAFPDPPQKMMTGGTSTPTTPRSTGPAPAPAPAQTVAPAPAPSTGAGGNGNNGNGRGNGG